MLLAAFVLGMYIGYHLRKRFERPAEAAEDTAPRPGEEAGRDEAARAPRCARKNRTLKSGRSQPLVCERAAALPAPPAAPAALGIDPELGEEAVPDRRAAIAKLLAGYFARRVAG